MDPNSYEALRRRLDAATLTWRGPALLLFARAACAVGAQAVVAAVFALQSSTTPWHDAEPWLPVYGTLIDAGCVALLWQLTRREGIRLIDLVGFERTRLVRDVLRGFALIPARLAFIFGGIYAAGWVLPSCPLTFDPTFMAFRLLASVPNTVFQTLLYPRLRRLIPFAIAHALMDGAGVLVGVLLPLLKHDDAFPCDGCGRRQARQQKMLSAWPEVPEPQSGMGFATVNPPDTAAALATICVV
jgi:hypothetical protein